MNWYIAALKNYAQFNGRARRKEYWMFSLFTGLFGFLGFIVAFVCLSLSKPVGVVVLLLVAAFLLAMVVPGLAVTVRRLHDTGRSGWWYLITFVPWVGSIVLLVFACMDSTPDNEYGPNPKGYGFLPPMVGDLPWPQPPFGSQ